MKLPTLLSLVQADVEPALVKLPNAPGDTLCVGTTRFDSNLDMIATINLQGRQLSPERRSTVYRLLQLIGEAVAPEQRETLQIVTMKDAPSVLNR